MFWHLLLLTLFVVSHKFQNLLLILFLVCNCFFFYQDFWLFLGFNWQKIVWIQAPLDDHWWMFEPLRLVDFKMFVVAFFFYKDFWLFLEFVLLKIVLIPTSLADHSRMLLELLVWALFVPWHKFQKLWLW